MLGKEQVQDDVMISNCKDKMDHLTAFFSGLDPLIKFINDKKLDLNLLFDDKGELQKPEEMMQLMIAPECLSKEKRKKINFSFMCEENGNFIKEIKNSKKEIPEQKKLFREKIVASLIQGYPLGNIFPYKGVIANQHINTIVGMKYDKETKSCAFKIRESQTGMSTWKPESEIFDNIIELAEIRKK